MTLEVIAREIEKRCNAALAKLPRYADARAEAARIIPDGWEFLIMTAIGMPAQVKLVSFTGEHGI